MIELSKDKVWVLIGDSITDCGRINDPEGMGSGYVRMIRDLLLATRLGSAPKVINKGIGGNKVTDLQNRWQEDVIALKPDLLSIKIGINDVWHAFMKTHHGVSIEDYSRIYRELLNDVKENVPNCQLVLCEPSVIWPPSQEGANELLEPYCQTVRELAKEFGADALVPLHDAFENVKVDRPDVVWTTDGVHPTSPGHMLIATEWLKAAGLL